MKRTKTFSIIKWCSVIALFLASAIISDVEMRTRGTITGLTIAPILLATIIIAATMVIKDLKEMREDDLLAPDDSEAENDEWY